MAMITMIILIEIHIKSVNFVLAYTQADSKSDIFMKLPIGFRDEEYHPRE